MTTLLPIRASGQQPAEDPLPKMIGWQHEETGNICEMPEGDGPGRRWQEIPAGSPRQAEKNLYPPER